MSTATIGPIFLSIVLAAYNEEANIERVILEHQDVLSKLSHSLDSWEIVCVDDGSVDSTPLLLTRLSSRVPNLRVLTHATNKGIFAAIDHLYQSAHGSHVYLTASDGQWPAKNLLPMFAQIQAGADYVVGVRTNRREVYDVRRRLISYAFNLLPKLLFGVNTFDAGSLKLGRREIFQLPVISRSPFAEAERIIRAQRLGYRIVGVPIEFNSRSGGKATGAKLSNIVTSVRDCLELFFNRSSLARRN